VAEEAGHDGDAAAAVDIVRGGDPAVYVPVDARPTSDLRRILVVHEGSRGDRAGMDAADEAAVSSGAEIVVLHVPLSTPSTTSASMPFRIADHGSYDWAEWQEEFLRRFCRCSPGVHVMLRVSAGSTTTIRKHMRDENPDLVIVSGPGDEGARTSTALDAVLGGAAPVLVVPSVGKDRSAREAAELGQRR
jgi:nucleotide-binding universal stress UspA family protein